MNKPVKVRFAPSPTGPLHVGGVRTALFNYLFAKKHGGEFLLRIEDTDQGRFVAGAEKYIIDSLNWLGLTPDDGINPDGTAKYRQSEREYKSYVDILLNSGHAYYAFDTKEELELLKTKLQTSGAKNLGYNSISRESMKNSLTLSADDVKARIDSGAPYVIRFNTPRHKEIKFKDLVKGMISFNSNDMDDKILFKSDGLPTYHLANIVDDHLMAITHVIRGDEWLSSVPLHIMLYEAFGWDKPEFCHLPLILGPDGQKLSKRHGDKYGFPVFPMTWDYTNEKGEEIHITGFKDEGYESDALVNFLALLGWSPGDNKEIMTEDEMISLFDLTRINNSGARFDIEKLKNFNAHYLRSRDNEFLYSTFIHKDGGVKFINSWENHDKIVVIAKERSVFSKDLYKNVSYFFESVVLPDNIVLKNPAEFTSVMNDWFNSGSELYNDNKISIWSSEEIKAKLDSLCELRGFKLGKILPDLRMALTGGIPGPHLHEVMEILGPIESRLRIRAILEKTKIIV
jgi:glutamyl-tRNA synthetase